MRLTLILLVAMAALTQDRDEALERIRAAEGNLRNAQFAMESHVFERSREGELRPAIQFCDVEGLIVPGVRARYHVKIHASLPALVMRNGELVETTNTRRQEVSFDGTTESVIDYALDSFEWPIRGTVNTPTSWQGEQGHVALITNRLTHVLPLYEGMGLSAYLATIPDEAPDWKVLPSEDAEHLTIWFPRANFVPDGLQDQMSYVVTLDLARGGNIVDWKWYLDYEDGRGQLMAALEDIQLEQVEGVWLPVSFVHREYSYDPKSGQNVVREETRTKLTWSHINAQLGPDAFHVEYPGLKSNRDSRSGTSDPLAGDANAGQSPTSARFAERDATYKAEIADLERNWNAWEAEPDGKQKLISEIRAIIDRYPGQERNIELEIKLAGVYSHEPYPDFVKELEVLESTLKRYPRDHPEFVDLLLHMADRYVARVTTPDTGPGPAERAREIIAQLIDESADGSYAVLRAHEHLGRIAETEGDFGQAVEFFLAGSLYDLTAPEQSRERQLISASRCRCAVGALSSYRWEIDDFPATTQVQLFQEFLRTYPHLQLLAPEPARSHLETFERRAESR